MCGSGNGDGDGNNGERDEQDSLQLINSSQKKTRGRPRKEQRGALIETSSERTSVSKLANANTAAHTTGAFYGLLTILFPQGPRNARMADSDGETLAQDTHRSRGRIAKGAGATMKKIAKKDLEISETQPGYDAVIHDPTASQDSDIAGAG